jgi:hypothetical protein
MRRRSHTCFQGFLAAEGLVFFFFLMDLDLILLLFFSYFYFSAFTWDFPYKNACRLPARSELRVEIPSLKIPTQRPALQCGDGVGIFFTASFAFNLFFSIKYLFQPNIPIRIFLSAIFIYGCTNLIASR